MTSKKKSFAEKEKQFNDGLENVVTGLGTSDDKNSANRWVNTYANHDYEQLSARYREDWVAQKVCDVVPEDMSREWRRFDSDEAKQADMAFNLKGLCREGYKWARLYGTSAVVMDLKRTGAPDKPLNIDRLKPNCIRSLQVVDRTRLFPVGEVNYDPMSPEYGFPEYYQLGGSAERIHSSRIVRFEGTPLPRYQMWKNQWYSDSVLIPLLHTIDNYHVAAQSAASLVHEANADIVTIEGLQNLLTHDQGFSAIMKRFRLMKTMKSNHNIILMDDTEQYSNKTVALNGVKDLIWEYLRIVAAAVGIPATRFLSASPDGMNATGESDLNNYIDKIRGEQSTVFDPRLKVLDKVVQAHYALKPWTYEWNSIFPESALVKSERLDNEVTAVKDLVDSGIITPADAQKVLLQMKTFDDFQFAAPPPPQQSTPKAKGE